MHKDNTSTQPYWTLCSTFYTHSYNVPPWSWLICCPTFSSLSSTLQLLIRGISSFGHFPLLFHSFYYLCLINFFAPRGCPCFLFSSVPRSFFLSFSLFYHLSITCSGPPKDIASLREGGRKAGIGKREERGKEEEKEGGRREGEPSGLMEEQRGLNEKLGLPEKMKRISDWDTTGPGNRRTNKVKVEEIHY